MGDNVIKLVVIGDLGVGKTSIIRRYVESEYSPEYRISVQLDFKQKQVSLGETKLNLQLWDVPGNERFGGMTSVYYKYSRGALVTFDLARRETFLSGAAWLSDYINAMELGDEAVKPVVLVGNKSDVENINIASREYSSWVEDNNILGFFEVSARNDSNVDLAINSLLHHILTS